LLNNSSQVLFLSDVVLPTNKPHKVQLFIQPTGARGHYISAVTSAPKNEGEVLFLPGTIFTAVRDLACRVPIPVAVDLAAADSSTVICLKESGTDADTVLAINRLLVDFEI